jgi:hypothetical protein
MELEQNFFPEAFRKRFLPISELVYLGLITVTFSIVLATGYKSDRSRVYDVILVVGLLVIIIMRTLMWYNWSMNALVKLSACEKGVSIRYLKFDKEKKVVMDWDSFTLTEEGTETIPSNQVIVFRDSSGRKLKFYEATYKEFGEAEMEKMVRKINQLQKKYATPKTKWVI